MLQVILKPDPGRPQELYLGSLEALGIDTRAHDVRFVEDNWENPTLGAWGLGWEVWMDGRSPFHYFLCASAEVSTQKFTSCVVADLRKRKGLSTYMNNNSAESQRQPHPVSQVQTLQRVRKSNSGTETHAPMQVRRSPSTPTSSRRQGCPCQCPAWRSPTAWSAS